MALGLELNDLIEFSRDPVTEICITDVLYFCIDVLIIGVGEACLLFPTVAVILWRVTSRLFSSYCSRLFVYTFIVLPMALISALLTWCIFTFALVEITCRN